MAKQDLKRIKLLRLSSLLVLFLIIQCKPQTGIEISCTENESEILKKNKYAKRVNQHTLMINLQQEQKEFRDEPPFDGYLAGRQWEYCAYNKETDYHLIKLRDGDYFTGILLSQKDGQSFKAGYRVLVSPQKNSYWAANQPNGLDGEEWKIYDFSGALIWEGITPVSETPSGPHFGELHDPAWNEKGVLVAKHRCYHKEGSTQVSLDLSGSPPVWKPEVKCPGNPY